MNIEVQRTKKPKPKPDASKLGFGQYFSDHMFLCDYEEPRGWHSPRVVPYGPMELDPAASVFHYGQELFEGLKAYRDVNGKAVLFRPEFNAKRMSEGAKRLCMTPPPMELFLAGVKAVVKEDADWIPARPGSLYIRPTLIGTEAFLGVRPSKKYLFYVILSPVGTYYQTKGSSALAPVRISVEEKFVRAAVGGLGATKAGANYAASLFAAENAKKEGCAQVLWLDARDHKYVEEVGTMNVVFRFKTSAGEKIVTPPLLGSILDGGTRAAVLHILRDWKLPIEERPITIDEVMKGVASGELKEIFGTGTAAVISPVGELLYRGEIHRVGEGTAGDLANRLYQDITAIQYRETSDRYGWVKEI